MYTVYTDGGCSHNPGGTGGAACVIIHDNTIEKYSEGYFSTTNNRMEVRAIIMALTHVPIGEEVTIYSDSNYAINCAKKNWSRNMNNDLWDILDSYLKDRKVSFRWVRGHTGIKYNEMCDDMCTMAMENPDRDDKGYHPDTRNKPVYNGLNAMSIKIPQDNHKELHTSAEEYQKKYNVNLKCARAIQDFFHSEKKFKDYKNLRTNGIDHWSRKKFETLDDHEKIEKICRELCISEKEMTSAARWHARGLSIHDSIRKALVDLEITQNAIKGKYR